MHLHICPEGHEQISRHLHFVHVMQGNIELVNELNEVKANLANNFSKGIYQLRKKTIMKKFSRPSSSRNQNSGFGSPNALLTPPFA